MGNKVATAGGAGLDGRDGVDGKDGKDYFQVNGKSKNDLPADVGKCYQHKDDSESIACYKYIPAFVNITNQFDGDNSQPHTYQLRQKRQIPDDSICMKILDVSSGDDPQQMWICSKDPVNANSHVYMIAQDYLQMAEPTGLKDG